MPDEMPTQDDSPVQGQHQQLASTSKSKKIDSGYPLLFRLLHWLLVASTLALVLTGFSLHAAARPEWSLFSGVVPGYLLQGHMNWWHMVAAVVFFPAVVGAIWVCWRGYLWARPTHVILLAGGVVLIVTGLLLMNPLGSFPLYGFARLLHAAFGLVIVPVAFLWHGVSGLTRYRRTLAPAFRPWGQPRWGQVGVFAVIAVVTTCLTLNDLPVHSPWRNLIAERLPPSADVADVTRLPWDEATPLTISLANGAGFDAGQTKVTLRALHDGNELFVLAEWDDIEANRRYMPWQKTRDGWQRLVSNPDDESVYYEDKFALAFPTTPNWQFDQFGCTTCCHVGGDHEYGYKGSDKIVDVWHWKSTRTDPVGRVDDKYWSEHDFTAKDGGRHGDPKEKGTGYEKNVSEDKKHPKFLPDDPAACYHGIIPREHAVDYAEEAAAKLPGETIIPGIVASAFVGDRGDVSCTSQHVDGRWKLWVRRKLDTGSKHDAKFVPGRSYPFGCAAFDHSSKRHAYSLMPYRLVLEE